MASTNPTSAPRPLHNTATLRVSNPSGGSEADGSEAHSSLPESDITYDSSSECDTDDLSMKERILWRAGAISPQVRGLYPTPKTLGFPPPLYSPSAQLALSAENISCHQQEAEELDINYLGILSPPPRVFHNPHPSYNDYYVPDRFSVRTLLEALTPEDVVKVERSAYYPTLNAHEIGLGVRPPTRALEPIKPLQIHHRTRPDPPTMYWDPTSQSMQPSFSSHSIYSQDSAPHKTSQYCPSLRPLPMRPGGSMTGSGSHRSALSSSHLYYDEPGDYPSSMKTFASVMSAAPPGLAVHRPRRRDPLDADRHGLPLIDEHQESTFTFPDQYPRTELSNPCWHDDHHERLGSQVPPSKSVVPPHPWVSDNNKKRERFPPTTVSQQPGHQLPMSPKRRIGNRNAKRMPYTSDGKRDWSSDLCMFCDHNLGTCCAALWCPCIIYARNKSRIEYLYAEEKVHPKRGDTCSDDCAIHACMSVFCLFGWAIQIPNRAAVRRRYDIEGDCIGDFAAALFCSPCELSQESREIDLEERAFGAVRIRSNG